mmetsp:Transcript_148871/g.414799  ORF Transcript_148871/g.414799 Transcript_148871/m.414799 type:complete len:223 (+) Transcript_148871:35-703(+)
MPRRREVPGPGQYNIPSFQSIAGPGTRGVSLKSAGHVGHVEETQPGPGYYDPRASSERAPKRCIFGRSGRFVMGEENRPGPCEYTPRDPKVTSERKTIGERFSSVPVDPNLTPGPGAYSPDKRGPSASSSASPRQRGSSFGGAPRWGAAACQESPGPAAYQQERAACARRVPAAGFGTSPRLIGTSGDEPAAIKSPGPGSYSWDLKPYGPKISITPRRDADV